LPTPTREFKNGKAITICGQEPDSIVVMVAFSPERRRAMA
jgi:hypothetical protein